MQSSTRSPSDALTAGFSAACAGCNIGWSSERPLAIETTDLAVSLDVPAGADADELEQLARSLRRELLELDVAAVEPALSDGAPEDARAVEALLAGALIVRLSQTSEALSSLIGTVRSWLGSHDDRRVRIELDGDVIELSSASDEERERLVDTWIERHGHS
jgi:hypothetical protein